MAEGLAGKTGATTIRSVSNASQSRAENQLDVVIVTYRSAEVVEGCIARLQEIPGLRTVIVVDHGTDGAGALAAGMGATVIYNPDNPGFGSGQNRGLALSEAPYVLLCNPDALVVPEAVGRGMLLLDSEPGLAAVQGCIEEAQSHQIQRSAWHSVGPLHLWARVLRLGKLMRTPRMRRFSVRLGLLPTPSSGTEYVEALAAIALLARREALESVGWFDEAYFMYWEDLDLSRRLRSADWRLLVTADAWAVHQGGASSGDDFHRERLWWQGCLRFAARWYPARQWVSALSAAFVQCLTMSVTRPGEIRSLWNDLILTPCRLRSRYARTGGAAA